MDDEARKRLRDEMDAMEARMNAKQFGDIVPPHWTLHWVLDEGSHEPRAVSMGEWAVWLEEHRDRKRVAETTLPDGTWVSTVFLGLDHGFSMTGPPILFETLVFGGPLADEMERYATWDEAVAGHEEMVARVLASDRYALVAQSHEVIEWLDGSLRGSMPEEPPLDE